MYFINCKILYQILYICLSKYYYTIIDVVWKRNFDGEFRFVKNKYNSVKKKYRILLLKLLELSNIKSRSRQKM